MKKIQRLGGKFGKRSENDASVATVIAEFKAMDTMLDKLAKDCKDWRNGWEDILKLQYDAAEAFANLYRPIEPTSHPEMRNVPQETPRAFMHKCTSLQKLYSDSKEDLKQEVDMITNKLLRPVEEAKGCTKSMQKTLKHRENMKLDYERYLGKVEHARKKNNPSPKEMASLERYEQELSTQQISYSMADQQVCETFPPVTEAVVSLMPYFAAILVELQTTLVGSLYTNLDMYCRKHNLPSPAPSNSEIISKWGSEFMTFKNEMEQSFKTLKTGQAVHRPMTIPEKESGIRGKLTSMTPGRKPSDSAQMPLRIQNGSAHQDGPTRYEGEEEEEEVAPPKPPRPPISRAASSSSALTAAAPPIPGGKPPAPMSRSTSAYLSSHNAPYDQNPVVRIPSFSAQSRPSMSDAASSVGFATPPSRYATPSNGYGVSPARTSPAPSTTSDYFEAGKQLRQLSANTSAISPGVRSGQFNPGLEEILAAKNKKKPPPPVPSKPKPQSNVLYVTALYDFEGQNPEDLPFREGNRIRVVKKTESTDDWWDGELNGRQGQFPANYVQI